MPEEVISDELRSRIYRLPFEDRVGLLVCSLVRNDRDGIEAMSGLINLVSRMAGNFNEAKRYSVADRMRNAADLIEREPDAPTAKIRT